MFDVMVKGEQPFEANPFIKKTLDSLKSKLSFDIPSLDGLSRWSMTYANTVIKELYKNAATLRESVLTEDGMLNVALSNAIDFTQRIAFLIERLYRKKPTAEQLYTGAVGAFARMCFLQDEVGNVYNSEMRINDIDVVSVPDLRLKGTLLNSNEDYLSQQLSELVVSVVEVVMTLLHMGKQHVDKLKNNWNLVSDKDKATIYYAKPLDMLVKEDRDLLLETFFKLSFMNRKVC